MSVLSNENDRKGILGTVLFHVILFLILLITGFGSVEPLDSDNGGVTVSFGEPDMGGDGGAPESASSAAPPPSAAEESMVTSESDAPEVEAVEKPAKTQKQTTSEKESTSEKEDQIAKERQASIDRMKKAIQDAKNKKNGTKPGEGDGEKDGEEGRPDGATNGDPDGDGKGTIGKGINYDLKGYDIIGKPQIVNNSQSYGVVVIEICLDKNGNILKADIGRKSTTLDSHLVKLSKDAVRQLRFTPLGNLKSERNCGTISFKYELN